jgi:hypothetical protein
VPEGVEKRLLIDGQQRLTTLMIVLALLRDRARVTGNERLADKIHDLIVNRHEEASDHYKLLPTQGESTADSDRDAFVALVRGQPLPSGTAVSQAAAYFLARLTRKDAPSVDDLFRTLTSRLTLVSIILDEKDNPHRIFESLNGKGRPLSQADLIRNFFFMRLDEKQHEHVYRTLWRPMQSSFDESTLTEFIRHYLTHFGAIVREGDVYATLKQRVNEVDPRPPLQHLEELVRFSRSYRQLLDPNTIDSAALRERMARLNRLEITVVYPLLLPLFADLAAGTRMSAELEGVIDVLESYLIRRYVCGIASNALAKVFAPLYQQLRASTELPVALARLLGTKGYPRDDEFRERLQVSRLYGGGDRREKTKLMLERLESGLGHKERVEVAGLTIEHVMPQTLTPWWTAHLGEDWEADHDQYLHTLGNLTLTSYNPELSNSDYDHKRSLFQSSHVELNRYFADVPAWRGEEIERRAEILADRGLAIWPYHPPVVATATGSAVDDGRADHRALVTGTSPSRIMFRGETRDVETWTDVLIGTLEMIAEVGADEIGRVANEMPKLLQIDPAQFRRSSRPRRLSNGMFVESNLSAAAIHRYCLQAVQLAGLDAEEWRVEYAAGDDDSGESAAAKERGAARRRFWMLLLERARDAKGIHAHLAPSDSNWIGTQRDGVWWNYAVLQDRLRIELYFDRGEVAANKAAYDRMLARRAEVETALGRVLDWQRLDDKRASRISITIPGGWTDEAAWPSTVTEAVELMGRFHGVLAPLATASG